MVSLVGHLDMARTEKGPMKEGLSFRLSVHLIVCPSSRLAVGFLRIGSSVFSET